MIKALADAIEERGYTTLTPVQEAVTNPGYTGADLLVSAQTGSGKTLGFGLAIAPTLLGTEERFGPAAAPLALIIAPTRELALQVKRELDWLFAKAGAVLASCVGGMDMRDERRLLSRGAHIVVATPGRLRDHIMRGSIDLGDLKAVVLDEADEMLDLGFREDLEFILGKSPAERQTLMFSATVPQSIAHLAKSYQRDAIRVVAKSENAQHADIEYRAMVVSERDCDNAVINTLRYFEAPNAIVFANTRVMVNRLTTRLSNRGFQVVALSGELSQTERTHALQAMRDGRARVCVATDVAARGIDLPNLDLVVHAELPSNHETLLHRSGRTGRAGRKGVSALIVTPKSRKKAERILGAAKLRVNWAEAPSADEVQARDEERMLADSSWQDAITKSESETVAKLVERFSPEQIAAAYLRLFHSQHSAPEELSAVDSKPAPRQEFGPSVWFAVPGGREANAEPRRLLPTLCRAGDITRDDIGAIRVQQDHSLVEIREASVAGFLAAIGPDMKIEDGAVITRISGTPTNVRSSSSSSARTSEAPRPRAPRAEPAPVATPGTTTPVDWNDDPVPRVKKPKFAEKPAAAKPRAKPADAPPAAVIVPRYKADSAERSFKSRSKPEGASGERPYKARSKPEGASGERPYKARSKPDGASGERPSKPWARPDGASNGRPSKPWAKPDGAAGDRPNKARPKPEGAGGERPYKARSKPDGAPGDRPFKPRDKPGGAPGDRAFKARGKPEGEGGDRPFKARGKPDGAGGDRPFKPRTNPGGAPAVGKPNSKKNKARAQAAGSAPGKPKRDKS